MKKFLFFLFLPLLLLTLLDFSPMFYQRLFGDGGTFVAHYNLKVSNDSILTIINAEFGDKRMTAEAPQLKAILPDNNKSGFTYVKLYHEKTNEYMHLWVRTSPKNSRVTAIIFYGISHSSDYRDSKINNRDYDYIFKKLKTNKFEKLFIDKLNESQHTTNAIANAGFSRFHRDRLCSLKHLKSLHTFVLADS